MATEEMAPVLFTHAEPRASRSGREPFSLNRIRAFARHPDPLVEASNWVALIIGTHLPFWPLYIRWEAGPQAMPSALLTAAMTPVFLAIPLLARRDGLLGRIAMLLAGIANTVFTIWVLGENTGTAFFLVACAALAAMMFRQTERWAMLGLTGLPVAVWCGLQGHAPVPLHLYNEQAAQAIFILNVFSVGALLVAFGWLQGDIYRRMEGTPRAVTRGGARD